MREFTAPPPRQEAFSSAHGGLADDLVEHARRTPERPLLARRGASGWDDVSAGEFNAQVREVAKGLLAAGARVGDRVALMSRTRYEWTLVDYAIWYVGAVTVPLYDTSSDEQVAWVLSDSGARFIVAETAQHRARVQDLQPSLGQPVTGWAIDEDAVTALSQSGGTVSDTDLDDQRRSVTPASLATIIYTSGATGRPRGCALTHANFDAEVAGALSELPELFRDGASTLLVLPLAHVFARILQVGAVRAGVRLGHSSGPASLRADLEDFAPTFLLAVPRVFEKLITATSLAAASEGRGALFDRAAVTAIAYSRARSVGHVGPLLRARHRFYDRRVYAALRASLGGQCRHAVSGGAPLGERLAHFYRGIGVPLLEGYGLTETTGAVTANVPAAVKVGSVGRPLPGVTIRVADDGELLVRGEQVFDGYWNDPQGSAEVLGEGWLHTGDLGEIDDEGFVHITGRKKEVLVTAGGKNVSPVVLEDRLRAHPLVAQCLVVGDGQPFIAALVTLDREGLAVWRDRTGKKGEMTDLVDDPDLTAEVQRAVDTANEAVSQAEAIRRFTILPGEWTEEGGQLTSSLKLRRHVVLRQYGSEVAALFIP